MREVIKYQSDSGKLFDTQVEAEWDDRVGALVQKMDKDIYWRETGPREVTEWLVANRELVLEVLK